jgi:hypothetical protein
MFTNELKKGDMVKLRNGWKARIEDNMKGNTRLATVYGFCEEMGSVYSHDIVHKINADGTTIPIEYTPAQLKCKERANAFGF